MLHQYVPLLIATLRRRKQPHAFSRLIWGLCLGIVGLGQFTAGGGSGAWPTLASCAFCLAIGLAALRSGRTYITPSDWFFLIGALLAIPVWLLTHDPLLAVIWATVIDVLGYAPSFRKSWHRPQDEMVSSFVLGCVKAMLGITALEAYSWTTLITPVTLLTLDGGVHRDDAGARQDITAVRKVTLKRLHHSTSRSRCSSTMSSQLPSRKPTLRTVPTSVKPQALCSAMEAALALSPTTATMHL